LLLGDALARRAIHSDTARPEQREQRLALSGGANLRVAFGEALQRARWLRPRVERLAALAAATSMRATSRTCCNNGS